MRTKQTFSLGIFFALLITGSSCSFTKGKQVAESVVAQFHSRYNAGQFREIYAQTHEEFRKATSETDFGSLLEALRRKLGTVDKAEQTGWHVNATPMGTMVTLGYNVEFSEGKGQSNLSSV